MDVLELAQDIVMRFLSDNINKRIDDKADYAITMNFYSELGSLNPLVIASKDIDVINTIFDGLEEDKNIECTALLYNLTTELYQKLESSELGNYARLITILNTSITTLMTSRLVDTQVRARLKDDAFNDSILVTLYLAAISANKLIIASRDYITKNLGGLQ